jgi:hypothetical protein
MDLPSSFIAVRDEQCGWVYESWYGNRSYTYLQILYEQFLCIKNYKNAMV